MDIKSRIIKEINLGFSRNEIVESLKRDGFQEEEINSEYDSIGKEVTTNIKKESNNDVIYGLIFFFAGVLILVIGYSATSESGGIMLVPAGLIITGIYKFFRGSFSKIKRLWK